MYILEIFFAKLQTNQTICGKIYFKSFHLSNFLKYRNISAFFREFNIGYKF